MKSWATIIKGFNFYLVANGHWICHDTNTCPILDTYPQFNVSSSTDHWTKVKSIIKSVIVREMGTI